MLGAARHAAEYAAVLGRTTSAVPAPHPTRIPFLVISTLTTASSSEECGAETFVFDVPSLMRGTGSFVSEDLDDVLDAARSEEESKDAEWMWQGDEREIGASTLLPLQQWFSDPSVLKIIPSPMVCSLKGACTAHRALYLYPLRVFGPQVFNLLHHQLALDFVSVMDLSVAPLLCSNLNIAELKTKADGQPVFPTLPEVAADGSPLKPEVAAACGENLQLFRVAHRVWQFLASNSSLSAEELLIACNAATVQVLFPINPARAWRILVDVMGRPPVLPALSVTGELLGVDSAIASGDDDLVATNAGVIGFGSVDAMHSTVRQRVNTWIELGIEDEMLVSQHNNPDSGLRMAYRAEDTPYTVDHVARAQPW